MNDLISRSALIESFYASLNTGKESLPIEIVIEFVEEQPTVNTPLSDCVGDCKSCWKTKLVNAPTVASVRGEWIDTQPEYHPGFGNNAHKCSICGDYYTTEPEDLFFCPRCGADMRGEKNVSET